ncbi:MAG TPA: hybrid sensor histidine kinase/response regulator, partial [Sphingobacteriaceae bacterium]|nr:hybrid sensor histidine kinase/response regulator [Sphingobacteriaceae bacterium]
DVILMDIHMPVMDGYEATHKIRSLANPEKASICIIALTASVSNLERRIKEVGMDDYIYKPFNSKELFSKLKKIHAN